MTKKLVFLLAGGALLIAAAIMLATRLNQPNSATHKLKITASFYPMAEFARQVGGDKVEVTTLVQPGVEPHDYDPAPKDLAELYRSKVFVYNGAGFEHWVSRVQPELTSNGVIAVDASNELKLRTDAGTTDPHTWLDPQFAIAQVARIEAALAQADPANAGYYREHAARYKGQLAELHQAYQTSLSQCAKHEVIASHDAFGYVADRYGFSVQPIAGLSPEDEPTPQKLALITTYAKDHGLKYIFFETLVSPKLADTIAKETGARTLIFNPLEGLTSDEVSAGANYLSIQQDNLNNLRIALECK